jgi:hypothetical protein
MHLSPAWTWCEWVNSPRSGSCRTGLLPPAVAEPVNAVAANTATLTSKTTRLIQIPPPINSRPRRHLPIKGVSGSVHNRVRPHAAFLSFAGSVRRGGNRIRDCFAVSLSKPRPSALTKRESRGFFRREGANVIDPLYPGATDRGPGTDHRPDRSPIADKSLSHPVDTNIVPMETNHAFRESPKKRRQRARLWGRGSP